MSALHVIQRTVPALVLAACIAGPVQAQSHVMDSLFVAGASRSGPDFQVWKAGNQSGVAVVRAESGSRNQHPAKLDETWVREKLASLQWVAPKGKAMPLLTGDESIGLAPWVVRALSEATPQQDVLVLSTARRDGNILALPTSVALRVFVADQALHMMLGEARSEGLQQLKATHQVPDFMFGSRSVASAVTLQSARAKTERGDWLTFSLRDGTGPMGRVNGSLPGTSGTAAEARPADFYEQQAQRLKGLQKMLDMGAITEDEYKAKRMSIIEAL